MERLNHVLSDYPLVSWARPENIEYGNLLSEVSTHQKRPSAFLHKNYPREMSILTESLLKLGIPESFRSPSRVPKI